MLWARVPRNGNRASAWAWAGMAVTVAIAMRALQLTTRCGTATPGPVTWSRYRASVGSVIWAVQYAAKMGFKTVGIARGSDKEPLARKLGAHYYIDSQAQDTAAELQKLGGAKVILATVTSGAAMSAVQGGLGINGTMLVIGAADSIQVSPLLLLSGRRSVKGWYSGTAIDS